MAKRINTDEIDESFIMASVKRERNVEQEINRVEEVVPVKEKEPAQTPVLPEPPKEETRRKRGKQQDYESLFIKESNVTARLGKTVYIRREFHDRILKIVQVIGGNEVSLFSYIDNVLAHHFDSFQDEITESYEQKNRSVF